MKKQIHIDNSREVAQTAITSPQGYRTDITLWFEGDHYEIVTEEDISSGWCECDAFELEATTEKEAREFFAKFAMNYSFQNP